MAAFLTLTRRELTGHFFSLRGYVVMAGVQLMLGASLLVTLHMLNRKAHDFPLTEKFPQTEFFWVVLLIIAPIITMRTFSHEKSIGTFETLMTTPIRDEQVVMAKFVGSYMFFLITFLPTLSYPFVLERYAHQPPAVEVWAVVSTGMGIALIGAFFMALGCFVSSLTRNQTVAAVSTFALGTSVFFLGYLAQVRPSELNWSYSVFQHISMLNHMSDFATGIVDTRQIVFYLSLTAVFLFLTLKSVESRRWK
ncbi:MAG: ABC transporter permease [Verrucomicrobiota bacterium]|jgi:ABC-2 type transport system permease protein|nr:ABC transporter permease [Verrucomicrobiota bacterium]